MKIPPRWMILLVLAFVGYVIGSHFPLHDNPGRLAVSDSPVPKTPSRSAEPQAATRRDPRTGESFAESKGRLMEISRLPIPALMNPEYDRIGKLHLEVARLFALASREEMIEFFADDAFSKRAAYISTLAYARLAELSLADALALWSDQINRSGKADGVDGLMEIWAKQDPSAAERWVDELRDPVAREIALFALLKGAVESDPDLVERRLTEIDGIHEPSVVVNRLSWKLDLSRFGSLADRLTAEKRGIWGGQEHLGSLLVIWGKRNSAEMMAWLTKQPPGRLQDHILTTVAESRAKEDPVAFARGIGPMLADNEALAEMAGQAWLNWLQSADNPADAMTWFQTHGGSITSDAWHWSVWTEESAERVLEHLVGMPNEDQKGKFMLRVVRGLAATNPKAALDKGIELLPPGRDTDRFIAETLSTLAWTSPGESLEWALDNLEPEAGQRGAIRSVMESWTHVNPLAAMERTRSLPDTVRPEVYRTIARVWTEATPDQALKHLKRSPDPEIQAYLARAAFSSLGAKRGGEAYLAEALSLPTASLKSEAVKGLFQGWSGTNAETAAAALQTFESGPLRDIAIEEFTRQVEKVDPEAACAWALEIGDAARRRETVLDQGKRWLDADRAAATRWMEASVSLPAEWKAELLTGAK